MYVQDCYAEPNVYFFMNFLLNFNLHVSSQQYHQSHYHHSVEAPVNMVPGIAYPSATYMFFLPSISS